jgi:hypothetical protein
MHAGHLDKTLSLSSQQKNLFHTYESTYHHTLYQSRPRSPPCEGRACSATTHGPRPAAAITRADPTPRSVLLRRHLDLLPQCTASHLPRDLSSPSWHLAGGHQRSCDELSRSCRLPIHLSVVLVPGASACDLLGFTR